VGAGRLAGHAAGVGQILGYFGPSGAQNGAFFAESPKKALFKMQKLVYNNRQPQEGEAKIAKGGAWI